MMTSNLILRVFGKSIFTSGHFPAASELPLSPTSSPSSISPLHYIMMFLCSDIGVHNHQSTAAFTSYPTCRER